MTVFRFRTWHCQDCGNDFRSMDSSPVCPVCSAEEDEPTALVAGVAPKVDPDMRSDLNVATATLSEGTKNTDGIARSLMADHGMTNMRDNQKEGDISAPPLTQAQQKIAQHGFWHGVDPSVARQVGAMDNYSGVGKGDAMRAMQNTARKLEGLG